MGEKKENTPSAMSKNNMELLDGAIERLIRTVDDEEICTMMRYAVFPGGKRIRPHLLFACSSVFGSEISEDHITLAAIVELLHCASLVHDDLPALDDDDMRRRKPTCHKEFGEGRAVLLGDMLQSVAFSGCMLLSDAVIRQKALELLSTANANLLRGQFADISKDETLSLGDLKSIHSLKTGALFAVSCELAAHLASLRVDSDTTLFHEFGLCFGLLFQYANDLRDGDGVMKVRGLDGMLCFKDEIQDIQEEFNTKLEEIARLSSKRGGAASVLQSLCMKLSKNTFALLSKASAGESSREEGKAVGVQAM